MKQPDKVAGDLIFKERAESGMQCFCYPKKGYQEKFAACVVPFGANMLFFRKKGVDKVERFPEGIAHFLEHKLFQQAWGDAFTRFGKQGASANAFTDGNKTVYYFTCQENFEENLELLIDFVQNPVFKEDSVEKEKDIIKSEIAMYNDMPEWAVYMQMLDMMYENHPIQYAVSGTAQTVEGITAADLEYVYESCYLPQKFSLVTAGNIDPRRVMTQAHKMQKRNVQGQIVWEREPEGIQERYGERHMGMSRPLFQVGWKLPVEGFSVQERLAMEVLLDLWAGESSAFQEKAFQRGWLDVPVIQTYDRGEGYRFCAFSGSTSKPEELAEGLLAAWEGLQKDGILEKDFLRIQKKLVGRCLRVFQSVRGTGMTQIDWLSYGTDLGEVFRSAKALQKNDIEKMLQNTVREDKMVLSVIR